ncbi:MAG: thioredoxin family protein [Candidatus Brocadiae bacterium]|nr:thioredoxin family protein [Candidatus Brocadiia bacterium]
MVRTHSTMRLLPGASAPPFRLPDPRGRQHSLADATGPVLVAFLCNHCPFVKHIREGFAALAREAIGRGVAVYGINSNDSVQHPDDAPDRMLDEIQDAGYAFPYLVDETQAVAIAYGAACTPDFFLFDAGKRLVYRGRMDGSRPDSGTPVTGADLRAAIDAVLAGRPPIPDQQPSLGCNIKWKPRNAPEWFKP